MLPSTYRVTVHMLMVFWAVIWRLIASTCDSDQWFMVNHFVSGCLSKVTSSEPVRMLLWSCLSYRIGCWCGFVLAVPAPCFLVGGAGPDYLTVQLTPNTTTPVPHSPSPPRDLILFWEWGPSHHLRIYPSVAGLGCYRTQEQTW